MWRKSGNFQKHISHKLLIWYSSNFVCKVVYMKGIKYVNVIDNSPVVIEIWGIENGDVAVPVNNTLVCCMSFLAADTWLCVLINNTLVCCMFFLATDTWPCVLIPQWKLQSFIVCYREPSTRKSTALRTSKRYTT